MYSQFTACPLQNSLYPSYHAIRNSVESVKLPAISPINIHFRSANKRARWDAANVGVFEYFQETFFLRVLL